MPAERDAIIRLRIEQRKARLEAPDVGPAERALKKVEAAAEATTKAVERTSRTVEQHSAVVVDSSAKNVRAFRESTEGALRFARGISFLAISAGADLTGLIRTIALVQGSMDVLASGRGLLAFAKLNPAIAAVTAVVAVGATELFRYNRALKEGEERLEKWIAISQRLRASERAAAADVRGIGRERAALAPTAGERIGEFASVQQQIIESKRLSEEREAVQQLKRDQALQAVANLEALEMRRGDKVAAATRRRSTLRVRSTFAPTLPRSSRMPRRRCSVPMWSAPSRWASALDRDNASRALSVNFSNIRQLLPRPHYTAALTPRSSRLSV